MTYAFPNPFMTEPAQSLPPAASPATGVDFPSAFVATNPVAKVTEGKAGTAVVIDHVRRSTAGTGLRVGAASAVLPTTSEFMDVTAGETAPNLSDDTQYIPELFSVYAARRCKDLISPPLPKVERNIDSLMLNAVGAALNLHPRDLDSDPAPLFLRKPRPAFLRALFELGDAR